MEKFRSINQVRKGLNNVTKMALINREYIDYEYRLIYILDKLQKENPDLVDRVHDYYLRKNQVGNWKGNWLK